MKPHSGGRRGRNDRDDDELDAEYRPPPSSTSLGDFLPDSPTAVRSVLGL